MISWHIQVKKEKAADEATAFLNKVLKVESNY